MRFGKTMAAGVILAAATAAGMLLATSGVSAQNALSTAPKAVTTPPSEKPAPNQPAGGNAAVPVKQVVLYSSGVGYFEHFGTIRGDGTTELRFKTQQINDILKSLILQDLDGGRVSAVNYPSQDPLEKTLQSFEVNITGDPSLADLLSQLRGAQVSVTNEQGQQLTGTILGVEKKERPAGDGKEGEKKVVELAYLNLLTNTGIRSLQLDNVRDIQLQDPQLRDELNKALAAVAQARGQDKKPVTINFGGQGERRVRLGYVVETPIWKTSYRLLLSDAPLAADAAEKDKKANPGAAPHGDQLQGWAIVENQTDFDWNDVQLSLVSGRPISFIQNLYQPLYIPRPVVKPELYASLTPQTYQAGLNELADAPQLNLEISAAPKQDAQLRAEMAAPMGSKRGAAGFGRYGGYDMAGGGMPGTTSLAAAANGPMDAAASVASLASATKLGELFQYTVGSVSLPRQKSAMIPIVTDPLEVEKLSIYNAGVLARNPLYGARVKNTTGKHLLQGPITVLSNGSYAGDAKIEDLPPGQERLISYGVDLEVAVDATKNTTESSILTGKIVKGVLQLSHRDVFSQDYVAQNKGDKAKTMVFEHPVRQGWTLVKPEKADETTEQLHRFKGKLEPGKTNKLTVVQQVVRGESLALLPADLGTLDFYSKSGSIPKDVRDAITKAIQLRQGMVETERQIQQQQQKINDVTQQQTRMRENMKTVSPDTDYYRRLLKRLDEQETEIDKSRMDVETLQQKLEQQRKAMEDYLNSLNVG